MLKALALVRTLFLLVVLYYTIRATPMMLGLPENVTDPYQICKASNGAFQKAIWLAIAWIALETAIGWWMATRGAKKLVKDQPSPGSSEPPFAPPR